MRKIRYEITEEISILNDEARMVHGIAVYDATEHSLIASVKDISPDREQLALLVERCNRLGLSPIHLHDVVEDFLLDQYS